MIWTIGRVTFPVRFHPAIPCLYRQTVPLDIYAFITSAWADISISLTTGPGDAGRSHVVGGGGVRQNTGHLRGSGTSFLKKIPSLWRIRHFYHRGKETPQELSRPFPPGVHIFGDEDSGSYVQGKRTRCLFHGIQCMINLTRRTQPGWITRKYKPPRVWCKAL